jgi:hypothetical protein
LLCEPRLRPRTSTGLARVSRYWARSPPRNATFASTPQPNSQPTCPVASSDGALALPKPSRAAAVAPSTPDTGVNTTVPPIMILMAPNATTMNAAGPSSALTSSAVEGSAEPAA